MFENTCHLAEKSKNKNSEKQKVLVRPKVTECAAIRNEGLTPVSILFISIWHINYKWSRAPRIHKCVRAGPRGESYLQFSR